jgi:hypothetical protein
LPEKAEFKAKALYRDKGDQRDKIKSTPFGFKTIVLWFFA